MQLPHNNQTIKNPESLAIILRDILNAEELIDQDKEHFWTIGLNSKNNIKYIELVSLGILNASVIAPRETFRLGIMQAVAGIIIAHNHPSGEATPSKQDKEVTNSLKEAGKILGIPLLDHIIITKTDLFSFAQNGLL